MITDDKLRELIALADDAIAAYRANDGRQEAHKIYDRAVRDPATIKAMAEELLALRALFATWGIEPYPETLP